MNEPYESSEEYVTARDQYNKKKPALTPQKDQKLDDPEHPFYKNEVYGKWAARIRTDWDNETKRLTNHYGVADDEIRKEVLVSYLNQIEDWFTGAEKDLFDYRSQLSRLEKMHDSPTSKIAYEKERYAKLKAEYTGKPKGMER